MKRNWHTQKNRIFDKKTANMSEFVEKYINPFTDYGFKRLFGEEPNKELLLDFLQIQSYEDSLKYYRDLKNSLDTAKEEGREEREVEIAKGLLKNGISIEIISKSTGLSIEQIERLKNK